MVDLLVSFLQQVGCSLFAPDSARAKHGDGAVFFVGEVFLYPVWKFSERGSLGIDGVLKGSNVILIGIAGIHENNIVPFDQGIPVGRCYVGSDARTGVDAWNTQRDNFALQFDFGAFERHFCSPRIFVDNPRKPRQILDCGEHLIDSIVRPSDRPINPFGSDQECAPKVSARHVCLKMFTHVNGVGYRTKVIKRCDANGHDIKALNCSQDTSPKPLSTAT